jgi:hypothetical protein
VGLALCVGLAPTAGDVVRGRITGCSLADEEIRCTAMYDRLTADAKADVKAEMSDASRCLLGGVTASNQGFCVLVQPLTPHCAPTLFAHAIRTRARRMLTAVSAVLHKPEDVTISLIAPSLAVQMTVWRVSVRH